MNAQLFDVTSAYSVLSLFGPNARTILAMVTRADVANAAFPFATMPTYIGKSMSPLSSRFAMLNMFLDAASASGIAARILAALSTLPASSTALASQRTASCPSPEIAWGGALNSAW